MIAKPQLEAILASVTPDQQMKIRLLNQAATHNMKAFKAKFSKKNMDNWRASEKALDEYVAEVMAEQSAGADGGGYLTNINKIHEYLEENGWSVSKSGMYKHRDAGHIVPDDKGHYTFKAIGRFASKYLRRLDGSRPTDENKDLKEKRKAETLKAKSHARLMEIKADQAAGRVIERTDYERDLAARARVLKSDLDGWPPAEAPGIVELVDGDPEKIPDLIMYMRGHLAEFMDRYAQNPEV